MISATETTTGRTTKSNKASRRGQATLRHGNLVPQAGQGFKVSEESKEATKRNKLAVAKVEPAPVGRPKVETPMLSKAVMAEYNVISQFDESTAAWIVRNRSGGARILDILPIAKHLRSGAKEYVGRIPDAILNMPTADKEQKAAKKAALDNLSAQAKVSNDQFNSVWRASKDTEKANWLKVAKGVFFAALSDYLKITKRLAKVDADKRFRTTSIGLNMTNSGVVAIQRKSVHYPEGHKATEAYWIDKEKAEKAKAIADAKAEAGRVKAAEAKAAKEKADAEAAAKRAAELKANAKSKAKAPKRTAAELAELKAVGEKIAKSQVSK